MVTHSATVIPGSINRKSIDHAVPGKKQDPISKKKKKKKEKENIVKP
jgi:hypothetical protein